MLLLSGMRLSTSCKSRTIYVHDYCVIASPISANIEDKKALKHSVVSKQFIEQIVNHNDLWNSTCQNNAEI
jgi:hypothetical protein